MANHLCLYLLQRLTIQAKNGIQTTALGIQEFREDPEDADDFAGFIRPREDNDGATTTLVMFKDDR